MHIPDGVLSVSVWLSMLVISAFLVYYASEQVKGRLKEKTVPLMAIVAAFVFAAQMLNVPITGGTSGHMLGGVLAAVLAGPYTATIIMTAVFIVQAIFFQDGGITSIGANILNMGMIGTILGFYIYKYINDRIDQPLTSTAFAAWLTVVLASAACAIELAVSGVTPLEVVLPAMTGIHLLVGLVEAGMTVTVLAYLVETRPDLMKLTKL